MKLKESTVLVTGANRGIGLAFAREALNRGARRARGERGFLPACLRRFRFPRSSARTR